MKRATLCAEADTPERELLSNWLIKWEQRLSACSPNQGCGCCIDLYDVEAPEEALQELPHSLFCASVWAGDE